MTCQICLNSYLELICFEQDGNLLLSCPQADCDGVKDCFSLGISGIEDNTPQQTHIYPNPTTETVKISLPESWGNGASHVLVFNTNGQQMLARTFESSQLEINLKDFPNGMYVIQIEGADKQIFNKKIIKQ